MDLQELVTRVLSNDTMWFIENCIKDAEIINKEARKISADGKLVGNKGFLYSVPDTLVGNEDGFLDASFFIITNAYQSYMSKHPTVEIPTMDFVAPVLDEEQYRARIEQSLGIIDQHMESDNPMIRVRAVIPKIGSIELMLAGLTRMKGGRRNKWYGIVQYAHDRICEIVLVDIDLNRPTMIRSNPDTTFYTGDNSVVISYVKNPTSYKAYQTNPQYLRTISVMLDAFKEHMLDTVQSAPRPIYNQGEMTLFRSAFDAMNHTRLAFFIDSYSRHRNPGEEKLFVHFDRDFNSEMFEAPASESPLIDFTEKEWNFVQKHVTNREDKNIEACFAAPRYGRSLRLDTDEGQFVFNYKIDPVKHLLRIYMLDMRTKSRIAMAALDFKDIDHFDPVRSLMSINIEFTCSKSSDLCRTYDELSQTSPIYSMELSRITAYVIAYINTMIVIHDRPQRSKVIRYTERINRSTSKKSKQAEPEYKITRILKTTAEAKALIASIEGKPRKEAEYTMESWDRVGYTRVSKYGKISYIGPTTCHRHQPLSDKEIHLKL